MKKISFLILICFFSFSLLLSHRAVGEEKIIGQMEFSKPQAIALIKDVETSQIYIYSEDEIICLSEDKLDYIKVLDVEKDWLVIDKNQIGEIICIGKNEFLPGSDKMIFLKGVEIDKIRFSYIYGFGDESKFKFSKLNGDTITLSRNYKPTNENFKIDKESVKKIRLEHTNDGRIVVDRKSVEHILKSSQVIVENMLDNFNKDKDRKKEILNLKISSSAAEIILGSSGILVKRFFLKKLPQDLDLQEGDLIKRINHKPINSLTDVYRTVKEINSTDGIIRLEVDLIRNCRLVKKYFEIR